jgi:hypothetical protein
MQQLHAWWALPTSARTFVMQLFSCRVQAQAAGCAGVEVQGNLVRQGPDGRGSMARHAGSFLGKRVSGGCGVEQGVYGTLG